MPDDDLHMDRKVFASKVRQHCCFFNSMFVLVTLGVRQFSTSGNREAAGLLVRRGGFVFGTGKSS